MTAMVQDMAMSSSADMTKTCGAILTCATQCFTATTQSDPLGCAMACAAGAAGKPLQNFGALATCLETACMPLDAGAGALKTCAETALATPDAMGGCATEYNTCSGS